MLERLYALRTAVEETLSGTGFAEFLQGKSYAAVGDSVKRTVRDIEWWDKIKALCAILSPCVKVMRMADRRTATLHQPGKYFMRSGSLSNISRKL